jgi:luciferase family oxidoreductase group 1
VKLSILDLAHVPLGSDVSQALGHVLDLARHVDALGYERIWYAEHHNMPGIASAATSVLIGQVAAATRRIRVGAGGIMLPNHAPLVIAEQFGTLEALFPGRIDLGLGRAPGTDGLTWRALRREPGASDRFPDDVLELQALLGPVQPGQRIRAVPGADSNVPLWILGSSLFGAQLAAKFGLPYAFASHFAPAALHDALALYRERFQPSAQLAQPYAMAGVNVICADTDEEARHLFTSLQNIVVGLVTGSPGRLAPPVAQLDPLPPHIQVRPRRCGSRWRISSPARVRRN